MNRKINVTHLSTNDYKGGAARATRRLHQALTKKGVNSKLVVLNKTTDDTTVKLSNTSLYKKIIKKSAHTFEYLPNKIWKLNNCANWSNALASSMTIKQNPDITSADIISLYWVNAAFLSIKDIGYLLRMNKPVVWRFSDMWPFTGGCHYSDKCDSYKNVCGRCHYLSSNREYDLSSINFRRKQSNWQMKNLTITCPSKWMYDCVSKSNLFSSSNARLIPTGVDTDIYKSINKSYAREILGLPKDRRLLLFVAVNPFGDKRKGGDLLFESLKYLSKKNICMDLVVVGTDNRLIELDSQYNVHYYGNISDDISLSILYSACDLFAAPSREENLANTVLEAMSCSLPCVAYNVGGMGDVIIHKVNGFLIDAFNTIDFALAIEWLLDNGEIQNYPAESRSQILNKFSQLNQVESYIKLYEELI